MHNLSKTIEYMAENLLSLDKFKGFDLYKGRFYGINLNYLKRQDIKLTEGGVKEFGGLSETDLVFLVDKKMNLANFNLLHEIAEPYRSVDTIFLKDGINFFKQASSSNLGVSSWKTLSHLENPGGLVLLSDLELNQRDRNAKNTLGGRPVVLNYFNQEMLFDPLEKYSFARVKKRGVPNTEDNLYKNLFKPIKH
ncbi:MAG: hypothetical protein ACMXX7_03070 [Candidatus Woesearchaeota archaeon]